MTAELRRRLKGGLVFIVLGHAACRVDFGILGENHVFECNAALHRPQCGTDPTGQEMTCVGASRLGGRDFCADACDRPVDPPPDEATVCVEGHARLRACNPRAVPDPCLVAGLRCLRTDFLTDEGVCTDVPTCDQDSDCASRQDGRTTCLATAARKAFRDPTWISADHLHCVQAGCGAQHQPCGPGQVCLTDFLPADAHAADICVPICDAAGSCPPNYSCARKVSGPLDLPLCIPALPGFYCDQPSDCLVGDCHDQNDSFKFCSAACREDGDCVKFDGDSGAFVCADDHSCQTPDSYRGSLCLTDTDCPSGLVCNFWGSRTAVGSCLLACDGAGRCPRRGGIPHACIPAWEDHPAICFPGYFRRTPCEDDAQCLNGLHCLPSAGNPAAPAGSTPLEPFPRVCSVVCRSDQDCANNRWIRGLGWCHPDGICVRLLHEHESCSGGNQCDSSICRPDGTCATLP